MPATSTHPGRNATTRQTALALTGAPGRDVSAPARIVAKGQGALADQILELAFAAGVKVREDADLLALLAACELGDEIPPELFAVVAELLAYLYRVNGEL